MVNEGRDLLAKVNLPAGEAKKIKALLDEAQKLHDEGSHGESVKKGNEALDLLKKK